MKIMEIYRNLCHTMEILRCQEASMESSKGFYRSIRSYLTILQGLDKFWNFMTPDPRKSKKIDADPKNL